MKKYSNILVMLCALVDMSIIAASYYLSEWFWLEGLRNSFNFLQQPHMRIYVNIGVAVYAAASVLLFVISGVYKPQRFMTIWRAWFKMMLCSAAMLGVLMALLYYYRIEDFSRGIILVYFIASGTGLFLRHFVCFFILRQIRRRGYNLRHVLLVGSGELARQYERICRDTPHFGLSVDGYFSPEPSPEMRCGYKGGYEKLEENISGAGIDEVIIAVEAGESPEVLSILACCEKCGTRVSVIPFYNSMISDHPVINNVGNMKCFVLRSSPLDKFAGNFIKRLFDILFSLAVLILLSPLLLIVAAMVKITSPGPVIFSQQRVGKDKKLFTMYKFRSMRVNAESSTAWSRDKDPRRTWFGSFIRKTSIDELPQFVNVLRGDMSIIGPRPEIPFYVDQFKDTVPKYMLKHLVRPGITGWAQVNGYRGDTSIAGRIDYDIWYIENWSVGLDLRIIFRTIFGGMINSEKISAKTE